MHLNKNNCKAQEFHHEKICCHLFEYAIVLSNILIGNSPKRRVSCQLGGPLCWLGGSTSCSTVLGEHWISAYHVDRSLDHTMDSPLFLIQDQCGEKDNLCYCTILKMKQNKIQLHNDGYLAAIFLP
jgi:hypothetical protein